MYVPNEIYKKALTLNPLQKAELIDKLISSLDSPNREIESGKLKSVTLEKVLKKYK